MIRILLWWKVRSGTNQVTPLRFTIPCFHQYRFQALKNQIQLFWVIITWENNDPFIKNSLLKLQPRGKYLKKIIDEGWYDNSYSERINKLERSIAIPSYPLQNLQKRLEKIKIKFDDPRITDFITYTADVEKTFK